MSVSARGDNGGGGEGSGTDAELKTKQKEAKDEDRTHLAGVVDWKQCWKAQAAGA